MGDYLCEIDWQNKTSNTILHVDSESFDDAAVDLMSAVNPVRVSLRLYVRESLGDPTIGFSDPLFYRVIAGSLYECKPNWSPRRCVSNLKEGKPEGRCQTIW